MIKRKMAVIGVGSAGIQSLCHFLSYLDETWEIYSIHDPDKKILGIGESANPPLLHLLQLATDFKISEDLDEINGTLKFGTEYIDWRKKSFINPFINGTVSIQFDTNKLKSFAISRFKSIWRSKFKTIDGNVSNIENNKDEVKLTINGDIYEFDYVIDCTGSPKEYDSSYNLIDPPLLTSCLVFNDKADIETPIKYTGHIATKDGWMFRVPLSNRTSYGYLYNNKITDKVTSTSNFKELLNISLDDYKEISFEFKSYYIKNPINNRVIKNGNAAAFIEPMFGSSLIIYDAINRITSDHINGNVPIDDITKYWNDIVINVLITIAFHYLGGSTYDTPFWDYAERWSKETIDKYPRFMEYINVVGDAVSMNRGWNNSYDLMFSGHSMKQMSRNLEYDYI
jgi:hypothetical protein